MQGVARQMQGALHPRTLLAVVSLYRIKAHGYPKRAFAFRKNVSFRFVQPSGSVCDFHATSNDFCWKAAGNHGLLKKATHDQYGSCWERLNFAVTSTGRCPTRWLTSTTVYEIRCCVYLVTVAFNRGTIQTLLPFFTYRVNRLVPLVFSDQRQAEAALGRSDCAMLFVGE